MSRTYTPPAMPQTPRAIQPAQRPNLLTPETEVTIMFRGGPPIMDMFDSRDYIIPPIPEGVDRDTWRTTFCPAEVFTIAYGIALHLQARAIVPGTRDRNNYKKVASQIGIIGIDRPQFCEPFTPEQLERFGGAYKEGLAREPGEAVEFASVAAINARSMAQSGVDLDRIVGDAADAEKGEAARLARDEDRIEGGAGVRAAQAGEAAARAAGRKEETFSETKPGRVTFADDPSKQKRR